jgi:16S rRNA (guanine(966)-N(2))-methyltransferase RsmD
MRVIAGIYRSRILKSLKGLALRPTSDRLRETLFNVLGDRLDQARFIDVFAGTGAVGIEAISRGAKEVVFVEKHAPAAALIRRNLESLEIHSGTTVLAADAIRGLEKLAAKRQPEAEGYDFVFIDPPYAETESYTRVLRYLSGSPLLAPGAVVIVEHRRDFALPESGPLRRTRLLKQGDAALSFFSVHGQPT